MSTIAVGQGAGYTPVDENKPPESGDALKQNLKVAGLGCGICCGLFVLHMLGFVLVLYTNLNSFQAWSLNHKGNFWARTYQPYLSGIESYWAMNPLYLDGQRIKFGSNFMVAGQVCIGDFKAVEMALTSPQARSTLLGASPMIESHLPHTDGGHMSFLLALSDKDAGGNGDHEAFKLALTKALFNHAAAARQDDHTSEKLVTELAEEYIKLKKDNKLDTFFNDNGVGWHHFIIRYIHYVVLGLDPDDAEATNIFTQAYYSVGGPVYYLWGLGNIKAGNTASLLDQAAKLYEESPAMKASSAWGTDEVHGLKKSEAARLLTSMMAIAAMQGPLGLGDRVLGNTPLPEYPGAKEDVVASPSTIDMAKKLDELDLEDDDTVELHILETARLYAPVSATARVSQEPLKVTVAGSEHEYPAGTLINVPIALANTDKDTWGPTRYEFDPARMHLKARSMAFNMVGSRDAGRGCPGKDLSMHMLIEVVKKVGAARRKEQTA